MKKIGFGIIILMLTTAIFAQSGQKDQEFEATFFAGILTDQDFTFTPLVATFGFSYDLHFYDFIMISPELMGIFTAAKYGSETMKKSGNSGFGLSLNFTPGYPGIFYFGGGVYKRFNFFSPWWNYIPLELKLNAGIRTHDRRLRLGFFMLTPFNDLFKTMTFGVFLGYGVFST